MALEYSQHSSSAAARNENVENRIKKRKSEGLELPEQTSSKRIRPDNPQIKSLKTRRARKSVCNALKITRNKVAKSSGYGKPASTTTVPATRKPLHQVPSKINTGRSGPTKPTAAAAPSRRNLSSTVTKSRPAARKAPQMSTSTCSSANTSRYSDEGVSKPKKKTKRAPWDLKGQVQDLKEELTMAKKKENLMEDILSRLQALESEKENITVEKNTLSSDLSRRQQDLSSLQQKLFNFETENRNLKINEEDLMRQNRSLQKSVDELDLEVRQLRREKISADEKINSQSKEIDELKEKILSLEMTAEQKLQVIEKQENEIREQEADRRNLLNIVQELKGNIRVFCRVRPMLSKEVREFGEMQHIDFSGKAGKSVNITNEANKTLPFSFDQVFNPQATQEQVFAEVSQLVQSALDGYNVCIFAYGQTGAGKTYTMEGPEKPDPEHDGIIPRSMNLIFQKCEELKKFGWNYKLAVQHVEIYRETLQDLLDTKSQKLEIKTVTKANKQNRVWVKNLTEHPVTAFGQVRKLLDRANQKRATASTNANERSSRSHSVFILKIEASNDLNGEEIESSLNLIDLAGSERLAETGSSGTRLKEAQKINGSLSELSNVISALANKDSHVPFRNSKLTFLLMDSLGGNSKTLMLVNVNPIKRATGETINTLRFATTVNKCNIGTAQKIVKF
uniref:Kinesin-like protein n=1 Tax=Phallusia mammillata TaxID=59560 RepID=A0A6F9DGH7_9ASCI|nr:carboxy-terminal kinesin 2 [Phallusia mammillata]